MTTATLAAPSAAPRTSAPVHAFDTPAGVIAVLNRSGVPCRSPRPQAVTPDDKAYIEKATTCTIGGRGRQRRYVQNRKATRNYRAIGLAGQGAYSHFVLGSTWAVATLRLRTAKKVSNAIGGHTY